MWQTSSLGRSGSWNAPQTMENWGQTVLLCATREGIFVARALENQMNLQLPSCFRPVQKHCYKSIADIKQVSLEAEAETKKRTLHLCSPTRLEIGSSELPI